MIGNVIKCLKVKGIRSDSYTLVGLSPESQCLLKVKEDLS